MPHAHFPDLYRGRDMTTETKTTTIGQRLAEVVRKARAEREIKEAAEKAKAQREYDAWLPGAKKTIEAFFLLLARDGIDGYACPLENFLSGIGLSIYSPWDRIVALLREEDIVAKLDTKTGFVRFTF